MKKILMVCGIIFCGVSVFGQDGESIVRASRNRISAKTTLTRSRMVITAKGGGTSERVIDQYSKDGANGLKRTVIEFQKPTSVKGSRFLTIENASKTNDQWIFLSSLGKVRRIAGNGGAESFMGTDFSYDDLASANRSVDLDAHTVLREENLGAVACYVVESRPKDGNYQYGKMISWIGKGDSAGYRVDLYDKAGELVKRLEMGDFQMKSGRFTAMQTKMSTVGAGTNTVLYVEAVRYDENIPEGVFSTKYLESGKP